MVWMLKERRYLEDQRTNDEKYDYRGSEVVFEHEHSSMDAVY